MNEAIQILYDSEKIQKALSFLKEDAENTVAQQIELAGIPAYSNHEEKKAARFREIMDEMGYETVQDEVGNVFAVIEGPKEAPVVMITAHMDTVFPMDTNLIMRREGSRICMPGICDDTRGCAEVLSILRAMKEAEIRPACTLLIGGDVGEEGVGNFRGVRHIFNTKKTKVDAFLSLDGCGDNLVYGALSDVQYRVTLRGPGGHSVGAFGLVNPILCLGRAVAKIAELRVPEDPFTIFNVSTVHGGTGVTSIASECSFTMDVRSKDAAVMESVREKCLAIVKECADEEYARWEAERALAAKDGRIARFDPEARIQIEVEELGGSYGGSQNPDCEIVTLLKDAFEACGMQPKLQDLSSTDANIPLSLGIPAATLGCGGKSGGTHDISEWFDPTDAYLGTQKNMLCILALTGVEGVIPPQISKTQTV